MALERFIERFYTMENSLNLMPFFQTMLGGTLTLLGVFIVQRKSDKRERNKLFREIIQECYEHLVKMEKCYSNESIAIYKGIREKNIKTLHDSKSGDVGYDASTKIISLIELYFPEYQELSDSLCEVEMSILNFHCEIIDKFSNISIEDYNKKSEQLSDDLADSIFHLKTALSDTMQRYTIF